MVHLEDRQIALVQMSEVSSCLTRELYFFDPAIESTNQSAIGKAIYFGEIPVSDSRLGRARFSTELSYLRFLNI